MSVISFSSELAAPTNVNAVQTINSSVTNKEDYTREYAVTALKADGSQESERSESCSVKCNPYGDGAYNTVTWDQVEGAGLYRIYRNVGVCGRISVRQKPQQLGTKTFRLTPQLLLRFTTTLSTWPRVSKA